MTGVASANTGSAAPGGYGISGYGTGGYGMPTVDGSVAIRTDSATAVGQTSAQLTGTVIDLGGASSAEIAFEWGPASAELQNTTSTQLVSTTESVTENIDELTPGTTYAFRIVAVGTNGSTDTGTTRQFTTQTDTADVESDTKLLPRDGQLVNARYQTEHGGYTGDGFVNFRQSDSYVEWDIENDEATEVDLTIRYALAAGDRTGLLTAGGTRRELTLQSTGGWATWETTTERVSLPEGPATVRIEATGEDFGNVDVVDLSRVSTESPTDETPESPESPESPTTKTLLARDGNLTNATVESEHAGYTGEGFVNFDQSDSAVEWTVENDEATEIDLTIRYALAAGDRTGLLAVGDLQRDVTAQSTGGWTTWETTTERVTLPAGSSTVRIEATGEDFGNVDAVTLTPREESSSETWDSRTLRPRDSELQNASYESEHSGYTGNGFVNFVQTDSYVQWNVENSAAAEFDLTIRYALGGGDRTGLLTAGDSQREVTVQSTGGWATWETTTERVTLPAGNSTVRIEATGEDFGNVDAVELERVQ